MVLITTETITSIIFKNKNYISSNDTIDRAKVIVNRYNIQE